MVAAHRKHKQRWPANRRNGRCTTRPKQAHRINALRRRVVLVCSGGVGAFAVMMAHGAQSFV